MESEASEEIGRLVLECGRPVKDEDWTGGEWRDFDWPHSENGCPGWQQTGLSEVVLVPFGGSNSVLFTVTHCRCACRLHPHVTVGLEGTHVDEV